MSEASKRSTVDFDPQLHAALRLKAAHTHRSLSDIANDAVRAALAEDQEDLAAFEERVSEPTMSYEALLDDLREYSMRNGCSKSKPLLAHNGRPSR